MSREGREVYTRDGHSDEYGMSLPAGKTCRDCRHFARCNKLFGSISGDEVCDWAPNRFEAKGDAVMAKAASLISRLSDLKRLERLAEKERIRVRRCIDRQLIEIEKSKKDIIGIVANEADSMNQIDKLCDVIRNINEILEQEKNIGAIV